MAPGHVVLVTNGIASTLHASLELARRLVERGHRVTFVSHVDVRTTVAAHGHEAVHLVADRDAVAAIRRRIAAARRGSLTGLASLPGAVIRARRRTAGAEELREVLLRLEPDVLVVDIEAHVAVIGSSPLGIPTVLTTFLFGIHEAPGLPPISTTLLPGDDDGIRRAWQAVHDDNARVRRSEAWRTRRGLMARIGPVGYATTSRVALRSVARRSGFDLSTRTDDRSWLRPHSYTDLTTMTTNLREVEFDHDVPHHWHYVGPMVLEARTEVRVPVDDRARLERFLDRGDQRRPLVYASLGSFWRGDADLLGRLVESFRRRPDRDLVLGLGERFDPAELAPLPPNVLALEWAPQVEVLAKADVAVVHGGNATLNECIVAGVPMLVCSTGHLDQDGIAARVVHHGLGAAVDGHRLDPGQLAVELDRLLGDDGARARVRRMQQVARDAELRERGVRIIEGAMASRGGARRAGG